MKDIEYIKAFGKHLKSKRTEAHLSQEELANIADISISQVSRIERGVINPTISTIKAIAVALEIAVSELFLFEY